MQAAIPARVWLMLLALSVLWGGSYFFVAVAVRDVPPLTVAALRAGIAAAVLLAALRLSGGALPAMPWVLLGMGLLGNTLPYALIVSAQQHIPSGLAAILNATTPLFTVLVAHCATRDERATPLKILGVMIGFAGVTVMLAPDLAAGGTATGGTATLLAGLACLAAALSYALAAVLGRRFARAGIAPLPAAAGQLVAASVLIAPAALLIETPWRMPAPGMEAAGALAGLGLLSTALAYLLYFRILAAAGATILLLVAFLIPVSALLLGVLVLGEALEGRQLVGMALIGAGLSAIDGRIAGALAPRLR